MDNQYLKSISMLESTRQSIKYVFDKAEIKTFEDKRASNILEKVIEILDENIFELKHYSKESIEGDIYKLSNGKWAFCSNGKEEYFSCGYLVEIFDKDENEWLSGRIEHSKGEYYFYNYDGDNLELYKGMRVRIRANKS